MILFIEPVSKNTDMYVPAYPLPLMEIGSFVNSYFPEVEIRVISMAVDYGLPLSKEGKEEIYMGLFQDISRMKPKGIGISCTAISQAEETIRLCELIKEHDPDIFIFLGGYFPTIYYEEIFLKTSAADLIVVGEGEIPALKIIEHLEKGKDPRNEDIPCLAWKKNGRIHLTGQGVRFDINKKALINLELLKYPGAYDVLPYAFSRGCPYHCNFCMEEFIRPVRKEPPHETICKDLINLSRKSNARTILVSDALFKSFNLFPFLRSLGMKVNFESRCDVLDPSILSRFADVCGMLALGFESASYSTLRRMNKVRNRAHYRQYLSNTRAIFREAVKNEIPVMVFMIAGYPGDTEEDLEKSLEFAGELSKNSGPGGHLFKIGECRIYPKTKIYNLALKSPDVVFDDKGVFGENIVRVPSSGLDFQTVLANMSEIFNLSNRTEKLRETLLNMMPLFRLPARAFGDDIIPDTCFRDNKRMVFNVQGDSLSTFKKLVPRLTELYGKLMSRERSTRDLST